MKQYGSIYLFIKFSTFLALSFVLTINSAEVIQDYASFITVHKDRSMSVKEIITVNAQGQRIKRGILRDFPTHYKDRYGNKVNIDFSVKAVLKNGEPEQYSIENFANGKRIYIGNSNTVIPSGIYTYTIEYTTNRQLGFYKEYDELFWTVTGQSPFTIEHARAIVQLPSTVPSDQIQGKGYIGDLGSYDSYYNITKNKNDLLEIATTRPLQPQEQFSVVVIWPKGYIAPPGLFDTLYYVLRDNIWYFYLIIGLLAVLSYYLWVYIKKVKPEQKQGIVIPLFYPPNNIKNSEQIASALAEVKSYGCISSSEYQNSKWLSPGALYYIMNKEYGSPVLSSSIVDLAVKGFIAIDRKKKFFNQGIYTLTQIDKDQQDLSPEYQKLLCHLFNNKNGNYSVVKTDNKALTLDYKSESILRSANIWYKQFLEIMYGSKYFQSYGEYLFWGIFISALFVIPASLFMLNDLQGFGPIIWLMSILSLLGIINIIFAYFFQGYTSEGIKVKNEIEGFKLFLSTTETERLKVIGTPPDKTPELYEEYLPYAIALGVEKQWSEQFVSVFKKLEQENIPYQAGWYMGQKGFVSHDLVYFSSNLSNNLNAAVAPSLSIPSSIQAPGSSSGWGSGPGGSGGAGRGGGGGGVGGW